MTDRGSNCSESRSSSCGSRRSRHSQRGRRKERVLHTRVSEQLSEDIRQLADDLRVPVSNLVRNVLEEVFTAIEHVSDDVGGFVEDMVEEADGIRERIRNQQRAARRQRRDARRAARHGHKRASADPVDVEQELRRDEEEEAGDSAQADASASDAFSDVLGWQPIVLNLAANCARCNTQLDPGGDAFMAISQSGGLGQVVCPDCTRG